MSVASASLVDDVMWSMQKLAIEVKEIDEEHGNEFEEEEQFILDDIYIDMPPLESDDGSEAA